MKYSFTISCHHNKQYNLTVPSLLSIVVPVSNNLEPRAVVVVLLLFSSSSCAEKMRDLYSGIPPPPELVPLSPNISNQQTMKGFCEGNFVMSCSSHPVLLCVFIDW